jgi:hypothetical protein
MTIGGWIIMVLSVGFVTGLLAWSICRVLGIPGATKHLHSPVDIEPDDVDDQGVLPK